MTNYNSYVHQTDLTVPVHLVQGPKWMKKRQRLASLFALAQLKIGHGGKSHVLGMKGHKKGHV